MDAIKAIMRRINREVLFALNLLGFAAVFVDPRATAGTIGYMISQYGRWFPLFLAAWCVVGVLTLLYYRLILKRPAGAIVLLLCVAPAGNYWLFGTWWMFSTQNAPISAFFIPFVLALDLLWIGFAARGNQNDKPTSTD